MVMFIVGLQGSIYTQDSLTHIVSVYLNVHSIRKKCAKICFFLVKCLIYPLIILMNAQDVSLHYNQKFVHLDVIPRFNGNVFTPERDRSGSGRCEMHPVIAQQLVWT